MQRTQLTAWEAAARRDRNILASFSSANSHKCLQCTESIICQSTDTEAWKARAFEGQPQARRGRERQTTDLRINRTKASTQTFRTFNATHYLVNFSFHLKWWGPWGQERGFNWFVRFFILNSNLILQNSLAINGRMDEYSYIIVCMF